MIAAGIGSRKGVGAAEVVAAVEAALEAYGVERDSLTRLATMEIKREESGIFEAGVVLGLEVVVVDSPQDSAREIPPPLTPPHKGEGDAVVLSAKTSKVVTREAQVSPSPLWGGVRGGGDSADSDTLSFKLAGVASVSEAAALAAAGDGARLAGPRIAVGRVTCAIAFGREI